MERLTNEQRQTLAQLRELTNGGNDEVTISVLESVDWDVQRAAEVVFGGGGTGNNWTSAGPSSSSAASASSNLPRSRPKPRMETFQVDDSTQGQVHLNNNNGGAMNVLYVFTRPLLSLLAFPLHILSSVFRFIFGVLRIPIPNVRFTGLNFYRPLGTRPRPTNRGGADRWVRELEEELGAICIGQLKAPRATTTAMTSGVEAGPSRLTARNAQSNGNHTEGEKLLPDFVICKYEEFLKRCQREARIGCVILVSEDHDDTAEFKRSTLTDSNFAETLYNNNILVWGGDVCDVEAWNASEKLQATTYPFVAFISLQPRRAPSSTSSRSTNTQPTLTVLSRHQGKSYPASTGPTSCSVLLEHLDRQLLPRVNPFLERIHLQQRERERDRQIREEQDRAFQEAAARDKARIEAKIAAEKAEIEVKRKAEEEARLEAVRKEQRLQEGKRKEELRLLWRCWSRKAIVEPTVAVGGNMRIAIRLASGTRVIQNFSPNTSLTALYAFVDTQLIPSQYSTEEDPTIPPAEVGGGKSSEEAIESQIVKAGGPAEWWGFQLVTAYPRSVIEWKSRKIGDLPALRGGGQLVVETFGSVSSTEGSGGDDDDEYKTESDEE